MFLTLFSAYAENSARLFLQSEIPDLSRGFLLYLFLHANVLNLKTALLIKCNRIIVLGIDPKLQVRTAVGSCQCMDILHHGFADTVATAKFMNTEFVHHHHFAFHHTGPVIGAGLQQYKSSHLSCQLCHIELSVLYRFCKSRFGILFLHRFINVRPSGNMQIMDLLCDGIDRFPVGFRCQLQH